MSERTEVCEDKVSMQEQKETSAMAMYILE